MLGSLLASIGGPLIGKLVTAAATAAGGPIVGGVAGMVVNELASKLGAPSSSEGDLMSTIQADLGKATGVVKDLEAKHGPTINDVLAKADDVSVEEAKSASLFVAGARPAALWVAIAGFGYEALLLPLVTWVFGWAHLAGPPHLPSEVWNGCIQIIFGLGGIRMIETLGGVARESLAAPRPATANVIAKVVRKVAGK